MEYSEPRNLGPIIVIEDDQDDRDILKEIFEKIDYPNIVRYFNDGESALEYLNRTDVIPFLILSDINMPLLDGFALRDKVKMDAKLQVKCIPYLFFTTASDQKIIIDAYSKSVQGFFIKPNSLAKLEKTPEIDHVKLNELLKQLDELSRWFIESSGRIGQNLREIELLNTLRLHLATPGGGCS